MEALKVYLIRNFEQVFVLLILVSVASINYLIPYKLAFLNFYVIPILLGAYYLGVHKALLGGVLCTLIVTLYAYLFPQSFMPAFSQLGPVDEHPGLVQLFDPDGSRGRAADLPFKDRGGTSARAEPQFGG